MKRYGQHNDDFSESQINKKSRAQQPFIPNTIDALREQQIMTSNVQLPGASLAKDLFQDMGKQVESMKNGENTDTEAKVVEEIESLCMNCREDVSNCLPTGTSRLADILPF